MSTVILDTITGKSTATTITIGSTPVVSASANSMTIRGEGSAQTSIQQGLCKSWLDLNGASFGIRDSFNVSSATDNGSGDYTKTLSSAMSNATYSTQVSGGSGRNSSGTLYWGGYHDVAPTTTAARIGTLHSAGSHADPGDACLTTHGDLA